MSEHGARPSGWARLGRARSLALIALVYATATAAGIGAAAQAPGEPALALALAYASSTVAVFAWSLGTGNSSCFDAWWSVAPGLAVWLLPFDGSLRAWIVRVLVSAWAIRLTANWARGWTGMEHEDWRYVAMREQTGRAWWLVSFSGIHGFPAFLVTLGSLALVPALSGARALGALDAAATIVTALAIAIEALADEQLRAFVLSSPPRDAICERGLWAYSRHPNYLGEVGFWWGLALFGLAAGGAPWVVSGALAITALFLFASIPLMEKRHAAKRPAYADYQRRVPMLFPWRPPRR